MTYDPVWRKCIEIGVAPTFHSSIQGYGLHSSLTNMVYNHIGHFGAAGEAVCKSLFLGGVTTRFPRLRAAFMEGGVSWGCRLYADLISHWKVRNRDALAHIDPANLDRRMLADLVQQYGSDALRRGFDVEQASMGGGDWAPENPDDFAHCDISGPQAIRDRFVPNFFGCEAEDPLAAWAFNSKLNPLGAKLNAILGSDIGHWDVPDMEDVIPEAFEAVEKGALTEEDFRGFTFANPIKLWASLNRDFFKGTAIESEAAGELARISAGTKATQPDS
jgi:hypothetical protein